MDVRQYEEWRTQQAQLREVAARRTLEEHDAFLRTLGTGDADGMTRRSYMLEHGLWYRDGALTHDVPITTPTVARDASSGMQAAAFGRGILGLGSVGAQEMRKLGATPTLMNTQMLRAPSKMFTLGEVMAVIRAAKANEADPSGDGRAALERLRRTFAGME